MNLNQQVFPVARIFERLKSATGSGGILQGLKFHPYPRPKLEGRDDVPSLCVIDYSDEERTFAGAKHTVPHDRINTNVETDMEIMLMLAVWRENGLYHPDGVNAPPGKRGLLDWIVLVKDVIENNTNNEPDAGIAGSCRMPVSLAVSDNTITDVAWAVGIRIRLHPLASKRGTRRDIFMTV